MWNVLVKGITVHQLYWLDTLESPSPYLPLSLIFTLIRKVFKNMSLLTNPFAPALVQSLINGPLGFIKSFPSSKPFCPLNLSSSLALTYFSMLSQWSIISTTFSSYSPLLLLDFPVKPGSQHPNKNSLAQSSSLQECPGGTGRGSVVLWDGGDKVHSGLATQLDTGIYLRVATCS